MKMKRLYSIMITVILSLIPLTVYAHEGGNVPFGGFLSGLLHPVLGYDHLLAMLCVGIISTQIGGKAIWTMPSTFTFFPPKIFLFEHFDHKDTQEFSILDGYEDLQFFYSSRAI